MSWDEFDPFDKFNRVSKILSDEMAWLPPSRSFVKILCTDSQYDYLTVLSKSNQATVLNQPVFLFPYCRSWNLCTELTLKRVKNDYGIYLIAFVWNLRKRYNTIDSDRLVSKGHNVLVLHCVSNERINRFRGRVGPINSFVPHWNRIEKIDGIFVSLFGDRTDQGFIRKNRFIMDDFDLLKKLDFKINKMIFCLGRMAACVGIQLMNTSKEEREIRARIGRQYHHHRPLILENGFYLLVGRFETSFLNFDRSKPFQLDQKRFLDNDRSKMIILSEGTHFIRTETYESSLLNNNHSSSSSILRDDEIKLENLIKFYKEKKILPEQILDIEHFRLRKIQVCLDCNYQIMMVDFNQAQFDFQFKS